MESLISMSSFICLQKWRDEAEVRLGNIDTSWTVDALYTSFLYYTSYNSILCSRYHQYPST